MYTPTVDPDEINSLISEGNAFLMRCTKLDTLRRTVANEMYMAAVVDAIEEERVEQMHQYLKVQTKLDEKLGEVYALAEKAIEAGIQLEEDTPGGF